MVFDEILGEGGGRLRDQIQVPVALLITAGGAGALHFLVLREEREVAEVVERPKQVVLVTASDSLARDVRDLAMYRLDPIDGEDAPASS